jgi:hypothetical protein
VKVSFLQSGGFVGAPRGCEVDSALLEPKEAREIERLVHECGLTAPGTFLSEAARDLKHYEIGVEPGDGPVPGERHGEASDKSFRVVFDDATVPATARPLLAYLKQRARPRGPG